MNPPFELMPWDKKLRRGEVRRADAVVEHDGKTWLLRSENGLLFFRDAANSNSEWTWTIARSLPPEIESEFANWPTFFAEMMERGEIARYLSDFECAKRVIPLFLKMDGSGWARELWNRDDLPFQSDVTAHEWLELPVSRMLERVKPIVYNQLFEALSQLSWPSETNWNDDESQIEWLCGSRDEFERIVKWICHLETALWPDATIAKLDFASENEFARARLESLEAASRVMDRARGESDESLVAYVRDDRWINIGDWQPSPAFLPLLELALDFNTPAGIYWEYHDYGSGRAADSPGSIWISLEITRPTEHEKLEAPRLLREWLQGKVSEREAETLVGHE